jgi:hypothetical protein
MVEGIDDGDRFYLVPMCGHDAQGATQLAVGMQATCGPDGYYNLGQAQLMAPHPKDPRLRWRFIKFADGFRLLVDVAVVGIGAGGAVLTAPYADSPTVMTSEADIWRQESDQLPEPPNRWRAIRQPNSDWFALQLVANTKQNLNVSGDGPYLEGDIIYSYGWGDGRSNELWHFEKIDPSLY